MQEPRSPLDGPGSPDPGPSGMAGRRAEPEQRLFLSLLPEAGLNSQPHSMTPRVRVGALRGGSHLVRSCSRGHSGVQLPLGSGRDEVEEWVERGIPGPGASGDGFPGARVGFGRVLPDFEPGFAQSPCQSNPSARSSRRMADRSQSRIAPSRPPLANRLPSGLKATAQTPAA